MVKVYEVYRAETMRVAFPAEEISVTISSAPAELSPEQLEDGIETAPGDTVAIINETVASRK